MCVYFMSVVVWVCGAEIACVYVMRVVWVCGGCGKGTGINKPRGQDTTPPEPTDTNNAHLIASNPHINHHNRTPITTHTQPPRFTLHVNYTRPRQGFEAAGRDYQAEGRLTLAHLRGVLGKVCGVCFRVFVCVYASPPFLWWRVCVWKHKTF